jgi:hypothetical protein
VPDVTSFLLLGDKGDVLIGGGHKGNGKKIIANIEKLGFDRQERADAARHRLW